MRTIDVAERRARLGRRHALASPVATPEAATAAVVVLHATDPATVYLSVLARTATASIDDVADALYERRSLVRLLAMRRTLFVAPRELVAVVEAAACPEVAARERQLLTRFLADTGIDDPDGWIADAADELEAALPPEGMEARQITAAVPRLATKIVMGAGTKNTATVGATSRVLGVLAVEGRLMRGRPKSNWTGRQYVWHRRADWLGADRPEPPDPEAAAADLLGRWLAAFGPGTMTDLRWTKWTVAKVKGALARLDTVEVDVGGTTGIVLADDAEPVDSPDPWAALLPSLDPTPMGWKERWWYLGGHEAPLFDRFGNIGPSVWVDGRIVGGWSQRADGEVVVELLEDVGADHRAMIDAEARRIGAAVGGTVVKPSFPTPLQKELSASSPSPGWRPAGP